MLVFKIFVYFSPIDFQKHRVVNPANTQSVRQSIVCFVHPEADCIVECTDGSNKYPPVTAKDYIDMRFKETEI